MLDPRDAQQVLDVLALTGATTLVAAMATDAWRTTRTGAARLFHRRGRALSAIEVQLDGDAELVEQDDDARQDLVGPWRRRLIALLHEFPEAEAELTALIDQVRRELPPAQRDWVQTNLATGHGVVNAVQHGNQYTFYMDSPDSQGRRSPEAGEATP
jgi:hypothetical protein